MNTDKKVMGFFPNILNFDQTRNAIKQYGARIEENGWCFRALERKVNRKFIDLVSLAPTGYLPLNNEVEVGWRLAKDYWHQGYGIEAAHRAMNFAFDELYSEKVATLTAAANISPQNLMEELEMTDAEESLPHPEAPKETGLRNHILYRIAKENFS
jgi:RimJ/RimL family protein N-acetyltransferase